jgi:WD40 repeat protein
MAFSPDGSILASVSWDMTIKLWNTSSGAVLQTLKSSSPIGAIAFSSDGKMLAAASDDKTITLWDVTSGTVLRILEGFLNPVHAVVFSSDGKTLAVSDNKMIKICNISSGAVLRLFKGHLKSISALAFSLDSKTLASASWDKSVKLWDVGLGSELQVFAVDAVVQTLQFSADGTFLQTNRGLLPITRLSHGATISRPNPNLSRSVFVKEQWISDGKENILWIPAEYRRSDVAFYEGTVGFGHQSGRVSFMKYSLDLLPTHAH